jgi:hypothetical protein
MDKNVTIPLSLLKNIIVLLEYWDISSFDQAVRDDYWHAVSALRMKLYKLDIREAYTKIVKATNEDTRHLARIEYLRLKTLLADVCDSGFHSHTNP